jgi:hypothetical protein
VVKVKMISLRRLAVGAAALVVLGAVSAPALALRGHADAPRAGGPGVFGIRGGGLPFFGGGGLLGPGLRGIGAPGGAGGVLGIDVLTPAASFLGMSVNDLTKDLKGGRTLADEAKAKNKSTADLVKAIVDAETKVLDNEVAAGWITSDQEKALVSSLTNAITNLVNSGPPVPRVGVTGHQSLLDLAASFLGISVSDLQADLRAGKSLADEAKAKNKMVSDLVTALVAPQKSKLDAAVKDGTLTQAQADAILNRLTDALTNVVNGTPRSASGGLLKPFPGFGLPRAFFRN